MSTWTGSPRDLSKARRDSPSNPHATEQTRAAWRQQTQIPIGGLTWIPVRLLYQLHPHSACLHLAARTRALAPWSMEPPGTRWITRNRKPLAVTGTGGLPYQNERKGWPRATSAQATSFEPQAFVLSPQRQIQARQIICRCLWAHNVRGRLIAHPRRIVGSATSQRSQG